MFVAELYRSQRTLLLNIFADLPLRAVDDQNSLITAVAWETVATARTRLAEQRSELEARQRENTNLTTVNNGLSVRIDKKQSALAGTNAQLLSLNAQRTAEKRQWQTLQSMMTARLVDKEALIASLQRQVAKPTNDLESADGYDPKGL